MMTLTQALLLPAFVHVAMIFLIGFRMGRARFRAARAGQVKVKDIAVDNSRWPEEVKKIANSYQNQPRHHLITFPGQESVHEDIGQCQRQHAPGKPRHQPGQLPIGRR